MIEVARGITQSITESLHFEKCFNKDKHNLQNIDPYIILKFKYST